MLMTSLSNTGSRDLSVTELTIPEDFRRSAGDFFDHLSAAADYRARKKTAAATASTRPTTIGDDSGPAALG